MNVRARSIVGGWLIVVVAWTMVPVPPAYSLSSVPIRHPVEVEDIRKLEDLERQIEWLRRRVLELEDTVAYLREQISDTAPVVGGPELVTDTEPAGELDEIGVEPESVRAVLRPDAEGWAAGEVFTPEIARLGDTLYLLFATEEDNPGLTGIGYVPLASDGGRAIGRKRELVVKDGYERVESPEFLSGEEGSTGGTLYAADYYIWRVSEWARYITRRSLKLEDGRLRVSEPETVLTGSGTRDHWMGRSVGQPNLVSGDTGTAMYFLGKAGPEAQSVTNPSLGSIPVDAPDNVSGPIRVPDLTSGEGRDVIRGIDVVDLGNGNRLLVAGFERSGSGDRGIKAVLYRDGEPIEQRLVVDFERLRPHLPEALVTSDTEFTPGKGLELGIVNEEPYLYFPIRYETGYQVIYRVQMTLPERYRPVPESIEVSPPESES